MHLKLDSWCCSQPRLSSKTQPTPTSLWTPVTTSWALEASGLVSSPCMTGPPASSLWGTPSPHRPATPISRQPLLHRRGAGNTRVYFVPIRIRSHSLAQLRGYLSDLPTLSPGQVRLTIHLISQAQKVLSKWAKYLDHSMTSEIISVILKADAEATWLLFLAVCCQYS